MTMTDNTNLLEAQDRELKTGINLLEIARSDGKKQYVFCCGTQDETGGWSHSGMIVPTSFDGITVIVGPNESYSFFGETAMLQAMGLIALIGLGHEAYRVYLPITNQALDEAEERFNELHRLEELGAERGGH